MKRVIAAGILLLGLNGCSILVSGIVGAAISPIIEPQVDRALGALGLDWVDPDGTASVRDHDAKFGDDAFLGFPAP